jgi:hypothetical protein
MMNMKEIMCKMPESERMMMAEKMMGMCMCHDCNTLKDCSMNMGGSMSSQKGLFCSMSECNSMPKSQEMKCMCTSCKVASDMEMSMMNSPSMGKK